MTTTTADAPTSEAKTEDVRYEKEKFKLKTNNYGDEVELELEYKQHNTYPSAFDAVGGETGALRIINSVLKNRAKAAGSAPVRLAKSEKDGGDLAKAIATGQNAARTYEYEERGVGVKKRLENLDKIKADIKEGKIKFSDLTPEQVQEMIMSL